MEELTGAQCRAQLLPSFTPPLCSQGQGPGRLGGGKAGCEKPLASGTVPSLALCIQAIRALPPIGSLTVGASAGQRRESPGEKMGSPSLHVT